MAMGGAQWVSTPLGVGETAHHGNPDNSQTLKNRLVLTLEPDPGFLWLPVFTGVAFAFHMYSRLTRTSGHHTGTTEPWSFGDLNSELPQAFCYSNREWGHYRKEHHIVTDTQSKNIHDNTRKPLGQNYIFRILSLQAGANSTNQKALGEGVPLGMHSFLFNSSQGVKDEICLNNRKIKNSSTTFVFKNTIK